MKLIEIKRYGIISLIIVLFGLFVYPTMYKYDKLDQKWPVKINRITGKTKVLYPTGWETVDANKDLEQSTTMVESPENPHPSFERIELKSELHDVSTKEIEIDGIVLSKIHFTNLNLTGEIKNNNNYLVSGGLQFELFDIDGNVLPYQPQNKRLIIEPGNSDIFTIKTSYSADYVSKYRVVLTYTKYN